MKFKFFKKETTRKSQKKNTKVFYICDKRACDGECSPKCTHTSDITHAKNFKCVGDNCYEETKNDVRGLARKINLNLTNL